MGDRVRLRLRRPPQLTREGMEKMLLRDRPPLVLFATRFLEVHHYFENFITEHLDRMKVECLNRHYELKRGGVTIDEKGFPRDDVLVACLRNTVEILSPWTRPDLIIVGTQDGPRILYHNGVYGIPMGFVPKGTDHEPFVRAILDIIKKENSKEE